MAEESPNTPLLEDDMEENIQHNLDVFTPYFVNDLNLQELLILYPFSPAEKRRLRQLLKNTSTQAEKFEEIVRTISALPRTDHPFTTLVESLAEYPKIADILLGQLFPISDTNRRRLDQHLKRLCDNMALPDVIVPFRQVGLITQSELQEVNAIYNRGECFSANFHLCMMLPARNKDWYPKFLKVLIQNNHELLASEVDPEMTDKIKKSFENGGEISLSGTASCVQPMSEKECREVYKAALRKCHIPLITDMDPASILDVVYENGLLPQLTVRDIGEQTTTTKKNRMLSFELGKRSYEVYSKFKKCLRDSRHEHLADALEEAELKSLEELHTGANIEENIMRVQEDASMDDLGGPSTGYVDMSLCSMMNDNTSGSNIEPPSRKICLVGPMSVDGDDQKLAKGKDASTKSPQKSPDLSQYQMLTKAISGQTILEDDPAYSEEREETHQNFIESEETHLKSTNSFGPESMEVDEPDISLRDYQKELAAKALDGKNVIIVAPTGSGKTRVALRIMQEHMRQKKGQGIAKVIFLVNQVALANQQGEECRQTLRNYTCEVISGDTQRSKNVCLKDFVKRRDILIVTAQVLLDALVNHDIPSVNTFTLMIFDECHHTHANHTFNQIMSEYMELKLKEDRPPLPQIVGLTASVGVGKSKNVEKAVEHIKKLMANLDAEDICTVMSNMAELRQHVSVPEEKTCIVRKRQNDLFGEEVVKIMRRIEDFMNNAPDLKGIPDFAKFENALKAPADKGNPQYTQWVSKLWKEIAKLRNETIRRYLNPCRTLLEYYNNALMIYNDARTKDALSYLNNEMKRWRENSVMTDIEKKLNSDYEELVQNNFDEGCSLNPKLEMLKHMVCKAYQGGDAENSRGIVFVKTRDLARAIVSWMKETPELKDLNPIPFLGQNSSAECGGMTKGEQDNALKHFKNGKHKLIVATSVAEEGLDISQCNLVIRYDHVTNEIAMVQSRGRGRAQDSKYVVLAEEGTGVAEKEELNMIREVMMRHAIIQLQEDIGRSREKVMAEIKQFQTESNLDTKLKLLGKKRRIMRTGEFELRCYKCNTFICMSSDIKKVEGAHHVVVDESLKERVSFVKVGSTKHIDDTIQLAGKLICMACGENLGVICIHKAVEFPVIKIEKFVVVDMNGRQDTYKKWNKVPFSVRPLVMEDFRRIYEERKQDFE